MRRSKIYAALFSALLLLPLAVSAAQPAPNFKLPTFKSEVKLSSYRGKVVYVDFWASWCEPCRKSFPWMDEMQARYGKNLKVIAINLDPKREDAVGFLKKLSPKFTIAFDPDGKVAEAYKVKGMPSSYLIDQQGRLVSSHIGFRGSDKEKLESHIEKLIAKQQASKR
ncbi:MAG TPA: TlpA disulfide reductase family protein [Gammaproteobacteria bacterium]